MSGTPHLQGYAELTKQTRFTTACKWYKWHIENAYGNQEQNITYCSKQGETFERGEKKKQGKRTDLLYMCYGLENGQTLEEMALEQPNTFVRNYKGLQKYETILRKQDSKKFRKLEVIVLYGQPGIGKTRRAIEESDGEYFILDQGERVWFDGYNYEKTLIIDDF